MIDPSTIATLHVSEAPVFQAWEKAGQKTAMRLDPSGRTAGPMPYFGSMVHQTALAAQGLGNAYAAGGEAGSAAMEGSGKPDIIIENKADDAFSFSDVIDMINPLQHLPVIGMIYRNLTGDTIKPISNIIGGSIFGGPIGAVSSTVNVIVKDRTGRDIGENALAAIGFDIAPAHASKPDIMFETAVNKYESAGKNFARKSAPELRWNA